MVVKVRMQIDGDWDIVKDAIGREIAEEIYEKSQKNIEDMKLIATGQLKDSGMIMKLGSGVWVVKYTMPYAAYLEWGTRPHMPPLEPLIEWAKSKFGLNDKEARKVAWAVAKEIAKKGTKPRPFLRNAIDDVRAEIKLGRFKKKNIEINL